MSINADRIIAVRTAKTVYRDGDTVLKVFERGYSKASILNEALNQARIEETGLPVPSIIEVTSIEGKWAIRWQYIEGKTLARLMEENPDRREEYMRRLVDIQADVFSHEAPLLNRLKEKMDRKLAECDIDATARYELHTRLEAMPSSRAICHGDFNPSNIVIRPDGSACILDWAHVASGDPAADGARTYLLFWLDGDINGAEQYLDIFCEKTGIDKRRVQRWMPIVAAAQQANGRPQEREFLLQWVNVVDYE